MIAVPTSVRWPSLALFAVLASLPLTGCGGGGGGGGDNLKFVTADPRGMTNGGLTAPGAAGAAGSASADSPAAAPAAEADLYRVSGDTLYL